MTMLNIPDLDKTLVDAEAIRLFLGERGIEYTRWEAGEPLARDADPDTILAAFKHRLEPLMAERGYQSADVISVYPDTEGLEAIRKKFLPDMPRRFRDVSLAGTLAACVCGVLVAQALRPDLTFATGVYALQAALFGMLVGSGLVFLVGVVGTRVFRKPAMGFGDVKLMGLLGAVAGWKGVLIGFFIACFLGSMVGVVRLWLYRDRYLPFGPFLCVGCLVLALWPEAFQSALDWYLALFRG